jgi:hypothetical protein
VVVVVVEEDVPAAGALASGVAGGVADASGVAAGAAGAAAGAGVVSVVVVSVVFFSQPARAVAARATAVSRAMGVFKDIMAFSNDELRGNPARPRLFHHDPSALHGRTKCRERITLIDLAIILG